MTTHHNPVDHPSHYTAGDIECIDALLAMVGPDSHIDHCIQSAVAYLWRWRHKNGPEDLAKARWYINRAHSIARQQQPNNPAPSLPQLPRIHRL